MRVKVEQNAPDGNGSLLRSRSPAPGLPPVASALRPFYRTASLPCPYLDGQTERKLITEIGGHDSYAFYNELSRAGFRRSHNIAYAPVCPGCNSCVPIRIPVAGFQPDQGDDGDGRVLEGVPEDHRPAGQSLGVSRPNVIELQHFEHVRAGQPRKAGHRVGPEGDGGQHE